MSHLRRIIPIALAIVAGAAPAAQAKLDSGPPVAAHSQDLRLPDTRDAAGGYIFARAPQDLRSPDTRDAAEPYVVTGTPRDLRTTSTPTPYTAPSTAGHGDGGGIITWALIAFAIVVCSVGLGAAARSRRMRVPA